MLILMGFRRGKVVITTAKALMKEVQDIPERTGMAPFAIYSEGGTLLSERGQITSDGNSVTYKSLGKWKNNI